MGVPDGRRDTSGFVFPKKTGSWQALRERKSNQRPNQSLIMFIKRREISFPQKILINLDIGRFSLILN